MDSTDKVKSKPKVEYDGYYRIDTTSRNGKVTHIYCRGHKLKSWMEFEKSLQSNMSVEYQLVTETEYMDHHWTAYPLDDFDSVSVEILHSQPKQLPEVVKVAKVKKTTKLATTDRDIGKVKEFVEKPKKKRRKTQISGLDEFL